MPDGHRQSRGPDTLRYRWVMLAGLWLAYGSFGLVQGGIPPLIGFVSQDLNLSRSAMGSVLGAWPLIYIATAIPCGVLIDRFGLRRSLAIGVFLIALSGVFRAVAVNYVTLFLAVAVSGIGGPFISIGAPKLISVWFNNKDRGTAMGIYMTATPVGRIMAFATANSLLMPMYGYSWRMTLATFASVALLAGVVWWFVARDIEPAGASDAGAKKSLTAGMKAFPELLRIRIVQIILIMSLGSFMFNHGFNNWLPEILRDGGMTAAKAGLWATVPVAVGIIAILVIPRLATPGRRIPILLIVLVSAAASSIIVGTTTGAFLTLGLVLQGAAGRGIAPIIMLILMDARQVGAQRMGAAGGLYFTSGEVGGVLGPLLLGLVADLTGEFFGGLLMLAALCLAMAFLAVGLGFSLRNQAPPDKSALAS